MAKVNEVSGTTIVSTTSSSTSGYAVGTVFNVDSNGDITKIKNLAYVWPSSHVAGFLTNNGSGGLSWSGFGAGSGNVVGPGSATDNAVCRYDGASGALIQNSSLAIEDISSNVVTVHPIDVGAATPTQLTVRAGTTTSTSVDTANVVITTQDANAGHNAGDVIVRTGVMTGSPGSSFSGRLIVPVGDFVSNTNMSCGVQFDPVRTSGNVCGLLWFSGGGIDTITVVNGNRQIMQFNTDASHNTSIDVVADRFYPDANGNGVTKLGDDNGYWGSCKSKQYYFGNNTGSIGNTRSLFFQSGQYGSAPGFGIGFDNRASHGNEVYFQGLDQGDSTYKDIFNFSIASSVSTLNSPGAMTISTNSTGAFQVTTGGILKNLLSGNESTGAGSALLGANSPAVTNTAPYKWLKVNTSDGSTGYIPIWK